jgi:hypothetical protein
LVRACLLTESVHKCLVATCLGTYRDEACAWLSRLLLLLVGVELITMPLTQQLWNWDGFVRGGQDFELGLFMIVMCVCLGLLRAQDGRQRVGRLLAVRERMRERIRIRLRLWLGAARGFAAAAVDPTLPPLHGNLAIPLLI